MVTVIVSPSTMSTKGQTFLGPGTSEIVQQYRSSPGSKIGTSFSQSSSPELVKKLKLDNNELVILLKVVLRHIRIFSTFSR